MPAPDWDEVVVPGHWNLQGHGSPAYSNVQMPFPVDPPHPPDANPIGDHQRRFDLDEALTAARRILLRFDGIESAAEIWLNGVLLGTTRGSRLTHEFDVTEAVTDTDNLLAVRVAQFSDASYIENQDMWWLPGIFRSVTLLGRPAEAVDDLHVTADWDPSTGRGSLRVDAVASASARFELPELDLDVPLADLAGALHDLGPVEPWSAEHPRLYAATVRTTGETVSLRVGFRRIEVVDAVLRVNGAPIMLRGVNRHEHHPERGRVFDAPSAREDLLLMKRHHINAVRTSHYPPHPDTLDLFDELGFWVIDECDLESHGFEHTKWRRNPSADLRWRDAYLDRMRRTVTRDQNHPSVIMWSLGNEAHTGDNLDAMARWTRAHDPSRLIHYEGDRASRYVDVYSRMYAPHDEVRAIGEEVGAPAPASLDADGLHRLSLPFVMCEFAHAMGTGPGGLQEYWDLFERYPRIAGGFVWEWVEQAIAVTGDDGVRRLHYGGDFGETVHDGSYVIDGLVDADRTPRPGLLHYAAVIAPVVFELARDRASVSVVNRFDHTALSDAVELRWTRQVDGRRVASGLLPTPDLAPRAEIRIALPEAACDPRRAEVADVVTIEARTTRATPWAGAGHVLGSADDVRPGMPGVPGRGPSGALVGLDERTGSLVSVGGLPVQGPSVGFWRAPTDNDLDVGDDEPHLPSLASRWRDAGMDRAVSRLMDVTRRDGAVRVRTRTGTPIRDGAVDADLRYTALSDRALRLDVDLEPVGTWEEIWARLGLDLVIDAEPLGLRFAGRGPVPAYPDLTAGARFGWHEIAREDLVVPHLVPQESGARQGVLDATVRTGSGSLRIRSLTAPFALTVSPFARADIAAASHSWKLRPDGRTHISIDLAQSGVGTASCGPGILPRYRLTARALSISLLLEHEV